MVLFHSNQFCHTVDGIFPIFIPVSKRLLQGLSTLFYVCISLGSGKAVKIIKMFFQETFSMWTREFKAIVTFWISPWVQIGLMEGLLILPHKYPQFLYPFFWSWNVSQTFHSWQVRFDHSFTELTHQTWFRIKNHPRVISGIFKLPLDIFVILI